MTGDGCSLRVLRAVHYQNDFHWNYMTNLYPFNTIYCVLDGDGFVRTGEQLVPLLAGHAYLIPANTLFSCWCETKIDKLYVEFQVEKPPGVDVFSGLGQVIEHPFPHAATCSMCALAGSGDSLGKQLRFQGELLCAISLFANDVQRPRIKDPMRFKPILDDIARNLRSDLRLADMAKRHGWNPSKLSREFKKVFQCTLKQYVERLLVNAIKQELLLTDKKVSELSAEYRFCDAYYLSAFFKRYMNISPEHYRNATRGNGKVSPEATT